MKETTAVSSTICLCVVVGVHLAVFLAVSIYEFEKIYFLQSQLNSIQDTSDIYLEVTDTVRTRRSKPVSRDSTNDRDRTSHSQLESIRQEVVSVLQDLVRLSKERETNRNARQAVGTDLGDLFKQITEAELLKLQHYCANNSKLCLPGDKGAQGVPGLRGPKGDQGMAGLKGATGTPGQKGDAGMQSPPGPKGEPGHNGVSGPKGDNGKAGVNGLKGDHGDIGSKGDVGEKGEMGGLGLPGLKGDPGPGGPSGPAGPKGQPGDRGPKGDQGGRGDMGTMGLPGLKGEQGSIGPSGPGGPKGQAGDRGSKGEPGTKGDIGTMGLPGLKGERGSSGPSGPGGPKGQAGDKGAKGGNGLQGERGIMGLTGLKGEPGSVGSMGPAGPKGAPGVQGIKGETGTNGMPGVAGPKGEPGLRGEQGIQGPKALPSEACCMNLNGPGFHSEGGAVTVTEGSHVVLPCNPTGYPPPHISWTPDVSTLDQSHVSLQGNNIVINNVKVGDQGAYTCTASNVFGTSQKVIVLQVLKHIAVAQGAVNHTVHEGEPVVLECKFTSEKPVTVTWYHIGLDGSSEQVTSGITAGPKQSQLFLPISRYQDSGQYVCEAGNGLETVDISTYLTVESKPHIDNFSGSGNVVANKGETIRLWCNSTSKPPATITWQTPSTFSHLYTDTDGSLVVVDVDKSSEGRYKCQATNAYGYDLAYITLTLQTPPKATLTPYVTSSKGVIFYDCKVEGDQPLTVTWVKDGQTLDLSNGKYVQIPGSGGSHKLLINPATSADYGKYACVAKNNLGTAQSVSYAYGDIGPVSCDKTFATCTYHYCGAHCQGNCQADATAVFGSGTYSSSSSICRAAIHNGVLPEHSSGTVVWENTGIQGSFTPLTAHGITSQSLANPANGAKLISLDAKNV